MCALYVAAVYAGSVLVTGVVGGWWPDDVVLPGLGLMGGAVVLVALSLLGSTLLPFEALYQAGLHALTASTTGLTGVIVKLGPFGGAEAAGVWIVPWAIGYVLLACACADRALARQDL